MTCILLAGREIQVDQAEGEVEDLLLDAYRAGDPVAEFTAEGDRVRLFTAHIQGFRPVVRLRR